MSIIRLPLFLLLGTIAALSPLSSARAATLSGLGVAVGSCQSRLTPSGDGSFYGTSLGDNSNPKQTVFKLIPDGHGLATSTVLATFNGTNGSFPYGALLVAKDGNIYGTTVNGGANDLGTIFKVTPSGTLTTVITFNGTNGSHPRGGVIQAADGNFYGTTGEGGALDGGTVFKLTPAGVLTTLAAFPRGLLATFPESGTFPSMPAGLIQATDGDLYGTTFYGGANSMGSVYKVTTSGVLTTLVSFNGTNGSGPVADLLQAKDGNFYSTTQGGPGANMGTVFKLTPAGVLKTLVVFDGTNGSYPGSTLLQGVDGTFYGTTQYGGSARNGGTIFQMTSTGAFGLLYRFAGGNPTAGLVLSQDGNLYGTLVYSSVYSISGIMTQKITFPKVLGTYGQTVPLHATSNSGLPVSYSVISGPATVSGNQVTFTGVGKVVLAADQSGANSGYKPAGQARQTITVAQAAQTIGAFPIIPPPTYPASAFPVTPPTATSGLAVVLSVKSGPATISGNSVSVTGGGVVTLAANQPGNALYKPAKEVVTSFVVKKGTQTITFPPIGSQVVGQSVTLQATASSGLTVAYKVTGPATLAGNVLTLTGTGNVNVVASQAGDVTWLAAKSVGQTIKVTAQ